MRIIVGCSDVCSPDLSGPDQGGRVGMAEETPGEKTEKPTQKRLHDAAQKGDVLQSKELATAVVVMAGMVWIALAGPAIMEAMARMLIQGLRFDQTGR